MTERCDWCKDNGIVQNYHDEEWGIPVHSDRKHFEFLTMEVMQCGLNWTMMLKKRETFRQCFDDFDFYKIARYDDHRVKRILETPGMIKSERKIRAVIGNAAAFQKIIEEKGSFDQFLWAHSDGKTLIYKSHQACGVASNELSDAISRELKAYGFRYLGTITVYSHLQACGMINDHESKCEMYRQIIDGCPVSWRE